MTYMALNTALTSVLIGFLTAMAGWNTGTWQFWTVLLGYIAVNSTLWLATQ